jgi:hypothetical protein
VTHDRLLPNFPLKNLFVINIVSHESRSKIRLYYGRLNLIQSKLKILGNKKRIEKKVKQNQNKNYVQVYLFIV